MQRFPTLRIRHPKPDPDIYKNFLASQHKDQADLEQYSQPVSAGGCDQLHSTSAVPLAVQNVPQKVEWKFFKAHL